MTNSFLLLVSILSIVSSVIVGYLDNNLSIVILVMVFISVGILFTLLINWKKDLQNPITIFILFFLIYLLYTSLIHLGLMSFYGIQNIENDEVFFYTASNDIYHKIKDGYSFLEISRIDNYRETSGAVYFGGLVATLANIYGENSVLAQKMGVIFMASLIPMVMYGIGRLYFSEKVALYIAIIYGLFSFIPFLSSVILRDLHVALMFISTIYIVLQRISILNLVILSFVIIFSYHLRKETGIFMLAFLSIYFFKFIDRVIENRYLKYMFYLSMASIIALIVLNSSLVEMFDKIFSNASQKSVDLAAAGSMGVIIAKLPFGLDTIALFGYGQMQPFPPSWIFQNSNKGWFGITYLIAGISWFIGWGFILYGFIENKIFKKLDLKLILMFVLALIYLFLTSMVEFNPRRQMAVYPILYLVMVFSYLDMSVTQRTKVWVGMIIFYLILVLTINYIKI